MNDFRMRTAVLALVLGGGVASTHAAEVPSGADVTRLFASHKPLTQWPAQATDRVHATPREPSPRPLAQEAVDESRRQVAPAPELAPAEPPPAPAPRLASESEPTPESAAAPAPAPLTPALQLALQPEDGRLSQAVRRYAERNGWQLAWEIERDFPIEYPATFHGDFLGIIEQIVLSLHNTDAPIRVKVYEANRVLRVVHATQ
jgi:hypothetical protein